MTACLALAGKKKKKKYMRKVKSKEALIKLTLNSSVMLQFTGWFWISVMHDSRHTGDTRWILLPLSPRRPRTPWQHTTQDIQWNWNHRWREQQREPRWVAESQPRRDCQYLFSKWLSGTDAPHLTWPSLSKSRKRKKERKSQIPDVPN